MEIDKIGDTEKLQNSKNLAHALTRREETT